MSSSSYIQGIYTYYYTFAKAEKQDSEGLVLAKEAFLQ
jgi:hypothetical protein